MGREVDVHMEVQTADWQKLLERISRYSFFGVRYKFPKLNFSFWLII